MTDAERATPGDALTIAVDGWEGPIDLLLALARAQKVDLREISVLALVEQYLAFLGRAEALRLDLAADWLVMAAWLTLLKSALLLPDDPEVEPSPEELAHRLQLRLARLDAMREAGARLMGRDRIGRDLFVRGAPEGLATVVRPSWQASLFDLVSAYGALRARTRTAVHRVAARPVVTLTDALARLGALMNGRANWTGLDALLPQELEPALRRSALASSFVAALELARQGRVELRQDRPFAPLWLRHP